MRHHASPSPEFRAPTRFWVVAAFVLAFVLLAASAWLAFRQQQIALAGDDRVRHTLIVQQRALELESDVLQMEAEHRGFLVSGDDAYLGRRDAYLTQARTTLAELGRLTRDNPRQQERLRQIEGMLVDRQARMAFIAAEAHRQGIAAARARFGSTGKGSIQPLRDAIANLWREESRVLSARSLAASAQSRQLRWALALGPTTGMVLLCAGLISLLTQLERMKRVTEALLVAEDERDRFFSLSLDMLCIASADGYFKRISPAFSKTLGWSVEELLARPFLDFVHPDDRAATVAEVERQVVAGQPVLQFENRYRHKDGSWRVLSWQSAPQPDGKLYATARDVTERNRAETALRDREEQIRIMVDAAYDAFIVMDGLGRIVDWNRRAEETFGWSRHEALGKYIADTIVPSEFREAHRQGLAHFKATGESGVLGRVVELTALRKSGVEFPVEININPIRRGDASIFGAFLRDITERKESERSIVALNRDLSERTEALEVANKELEAFSYSVSHDLRAPVRHIAGYARMLLEDADGLAPEARRQLTAIVDSARRMGALIDDLLAFSRLGRQPIETRRLDMAALARRAADEMPGATEAVLEIGELPPAFGDPALMEQVWINLLSNALKYSAPRGGRARIEVVGERDGTVIRYCVRDNGVGFDMRYADKLFGVFQRLHSQDEFEGTGVGLAIVQRILARHGGRIRAEAEPEHGATFIFELPAQEVEA